MTILYHPYGPHMLQSFLAGCFCSKSSSCYCPCVVSRGQPECLQVEQLSLQKTLCCNMYQADSPSRISHAFARVQVDSLSARKCSSAAVGVLPPAAALSAEELNSALANLDLTQLSKTQNPVDIAQAARQMAALLSVAANSSNSGSSGSSSSAAMLQILASAGGDDPDAQNSLVSAAGELLDAGGLGPEAGLSLITLFR